MGKKKKRKHRNSILPLAQKEDNLKIWVDSTNKLPYGSKAQSPCSVVALDLATVLSRSGYSLSVLPWIIFLISNPTTLCQPRILLILNKYPILDDINFQRVSFIVVLTCIQKCLVCVLLLLYLFVLFKLNVK